jgi:hypothetical protein
MYIVLGSSSDDSLADMYTVLPKTNLYSICFISSCILVLYENIAISKWFSLVLLILSVLDTLIMNDVIKRFD